ncbi:hypothetical protein N7465_010289 [Penicillium sp. CMV-2018d]|nr:hypothetical protein N7465_010289 [Penicillium sp. CMV-2018d]
MFCTESSAGDLATAASLESFAVLETGKRNARKTADCIFGKLICKAATLSLKNGREAFIHSAAPFGNEPPGGKGPENPAARWLAARLGMMPSLYIGSNNAVRSGK